MTALQIGLLVAGAVLIAFASSIISYKAGWLDGWYAHSRRGEEVRGWFRS